MTAADAQRTKLQKSQITMFALSQHSRPISVFSITSLYKNPLKDGLRHSSFQKPIIKKTANALL